MSETQTEALEPQAAPAPSEAPETPTPEEQAAAQQSALEKRVATMSARMGNLGRERDELRARVAQLEAGLRTQQPGQQQLDPQIAAAIQQQAQVISAGERTQEKIRSFHAAGKEAYPDWTQRCDDLQAMGADPQFAELLVEMDQGHKVAAALRDDPEQLERIASLRGERARAIALGQYAAKLDAQPTRAVSKAPPPPKPIQRGGGVAPAFNEYAEVDASSLADFYSRQDLERRRAINRR